MSTGAIVGVAVASILSLVAVLAVVMLLRRRRQKRQAASKQTTSGPNSGTIAASLHESTSTPTSDPKPSKHAQQLRDEQLLDPKAAQVGEAANPPQLAGTLHKRSPTSGFYKKVKVSHTYTCYLLLTAYHLLLTTHYSLLTTHYVYCKVTIEGDTLRYADFKSDKSSVLHGSNIERLEVTNRAQLEFVLKTKTSGPERGRSYSFRVSTCATIQHGDHMGDACAYNVGHMRCDAHVCTTRAPKGHCSAFAVCACA